MSSFHNDLKPGVDLALGSLFGHSISFADFTDKNVSLTADRFQIRLRQSAPPLSYRRLKLSPTVFDLMPVHNMPRFAKNSDPFSRRGLNPAACRRRPKVARDGQSSRSPHPWLGAVRQCICPENSELSRPATKVRPVPHAPAARNQRAKKFAT